MISFKMPSIFLEYKNQFFFYNPQTQTETEIDVSNWTLAFLA